MLSVNSDFCHHFKRVLNLLLGPGWCTQKAEPIPIYSLSLLFILKDELLSITITDVLWPVAYFARPEL